MMRLSYLSSLLVAIFLIGCSKDDDNGPTTRDRGEVAEENHAEIVDFLETHSFEVVPNPINPSVSIIEFSDITEDTPEATPIMDSDALKSRTINQDGVTYTLYYLQFREGEQSTYSPTFADDVVVTYRGELLDGTLFDDAVNPVRMSLLQLITGFVRSLTEFHGASSMIENNDGTFSFSDDYGIGAVFVPSGLGYFARPPSLSPIGQYDPLIFSFQLYKGIQQDHDNDGIPSYMEDLNNDEFLNETDNSNNDQVIDYEDPDDDGDGKPTREEIEVNDANGDGIITEDELNLIDSNNDGTPDYLDPNAF